MAVYRVQMAASGVLMCPTPGHLGTILMQNAGYIFAGVDDPDSKEMKDVVIYNITEPVGKITYEVTDSNVWAIIEDMPNSQGDILTNQAKILFHRQ